MSLVKNQNNFALSSNAIFSCELLGGADYALQQFNLPGISVGSEVVMTQAGPMSIGGYKLDDNNIRMDLSFIVDEDLVVWKTLYNKISEYITKETKPEKDAFITLFDNNHNVIMSIFLKNTKIEGMGSLEYEISSNRAEIMKVNVKIVFDKLEIKK